MPTALPLRPPSPPRCCWKGAYRGGRERKEGAPTRQAPGVLVCVARSDAAGVPHPFNLPDGSAIHGLIIFSFQSTPASPPFYGRINEILFCQRFERTNRRAPTYSFFPYLYQSKLSEAIARYTTSTRSKAVIASEGRKLLPYGVKSSRGGVVAEVLISGQAKSRNYGTRMAKNHDIKKKGRTSTPV